MEYDHICTDENCNHTWADSYSIKADPPKICPKCNQETAKRLISGCGYGRVELSDDEFKASLKDSTRQMQKEMHSDANIYSNMIGPDKYQALQTAIDKRKREKY